MIRQASKEELKAFFEELKEFHLKGKHDFIWDWDQIVDADEISVTRDFVYYIAFNLSKNILHGPLPRSLHSRMVFDSNAWSK